MKNRSVDLVIKDEKNMDTLLKFLIYKLDTANGQRGSGLKISKFIGKHILMVKTMLKYRILRIRYKISYHAFVKR